MDEVIVNMHEAKTHLSRLIERAEQGETIVIAKAGTPKVVLQLVPSTQPRQAGRFAGQIVLAEDFDAALPEDDLQAWEGQRP